MTIRSAQSSDYQELISLYNEFVGDNRYKFSDNDSFHRVITNLKNFVFVAEIEKKLVGFAAFSIRDVIRYPKQIAELDELFVEKDFRQKGVGKELLRKVEEKAKELDCYRLFIESHYKHEAAHTLYERQGYTNYGYHYIKDL